MNVEKMANAQPNTPVVIINGALDKVVSFMAGVMCSFFYMSILTRIISCLLAQRGADSTLVYSFRNWQLLLIVSTISLRASST